MFEKIKQTKYLCFGAKFLWFNICEILEIFPESIKQNVKENLDVIHIQIGPKITGIQKN